MDSPSRNQPCPCGSGRRYKDCHGKVAGAPAVADPHQAVRESCRQLMMEALAHQKARRLDEAEQGYRSALAMIPDEPDALHMLGVIRYEWGDYAEARTLMVRALDLTGWRIPAIRQNLGLVLSKLNTDSDDSARNSLVSRYREYMAARRGRRRTSNPLVSVVVPSFNHARYIHRTLRSVFCQTYRNVEIIVIDDGSQDGSADLIREYLRDSPFPQRLIARENRGAPATLNEGVALAAGEFVQFLNSDDWLAPERIGRMVSEIADPECGWGFSAIDFRDADDQPVDLMRNRRAYDLACLIGGIPLCETTGMMFLTDNVAVSTGNLFVMRSLFDRLGGFRSFRYNHDWDFCLRALRLEEPVYVPEPLYCYRLHGANTIDESAERARAEALTVCTDYVAWARAEANPGNPFAPAISTWGRLFTNSIFSGGMGGILDADTMRQLALA